MNIRINGKSFGFENSEVSLREALHAAAIDKGGIAVAVNNAVVKASDIDSTNLKDGDSITVIKAFYGG